MIIDGVCFFSYFYLAMNYLIEQKQINISLQKINLLRLVKIICICSAMKDVLLRCELRSLRERERHVQIIEDLHVFNTS